MSYYHADISEKAEKKIFAKLPAKKSKLIILKSESYNFDKRKWISNLNKWEIIRVIENRDRYYVVGKISRHKWGREWTPFAFFPCGQYGLRLDLSEMKHIIKFIGKLRNNNA